LLTADVGFGASESEWGRLFQNWGVVQPDAEGKGFPNVGEAHPELVRVGMKHMLEGMRLLGMAVTESPEAVNWKRHHGHHHDCGCSGK